MKAVYRLFAVFAALAASASAAQAHGPTPKKALETIELPNSPPEVWAAMKDFGDIADWHPAVKSATSEGGNENGAKRTLNLEGGEIVESLDDYQDMDMSYSYRLLKENFDAIPVSFYSATITVRSKDGGGSEVEWLSRFYRADTSNFPPEHLSDEAAVTAMTAFLRQGLGGLKSKLTAGQ